MSAPTGTCACGEKATRWAHWTGVGGGYRPGAVGCCNDHAVATSREMCAARLAEEEPCRCERSIPKPVHGGARCRLCGRPCSHHVRTMTRLPAENPVGIGDSTGRDHSQGESAERPASVHAASVSAANRAFPQSGRTVRRPSGRVLMFARCSHLAAQGEHR